ncbi:MAG: hypothetical protein WAS07_00385 [Micropruina sp.]
MLLTPAFALSHYSAYGLPEEEPPGWLAHLREPLTAAGILDAGSTELYDVYGLLYGAAWILALAGLVGLLRPAWRTLTPRLRRALAVAVTGLGVVALGIFGDYAPANDIVGTVGFMLTGVGFLTAAVGCGMLGWALRSDRGPARYPPWVWVPSAWCPWSEEWPWSGTSRPALAWAGSLERSCWGSRVRCPRQERRSSVESPSHRGTA